MKWLLIFKALRLKWRRTLVIVAALTIGGGGWGIDAAFRRSREAAKAARTD